MDVKFEWEKEPFDARFSVVEAVIVDGQRFVPETPETTERDEEPMVVVTPERCAPRYGTITALIRDGVRYVPEQPKEKPLKVGEEVVLPTGEVGRVYKVLKEGTPNVLVSYQPHRTIGWRPPSELRRVTEADRHAD
jgi:hypothetical protein